MDTVTCIGSVLRVGAPGRGVETVSDDQHSSRALQIQQVAFCSLLSTINFPANNGESDVGNPTDLCLYRRYPGDRVHQHRVLAGPRQGTGEIGGDRSTSQSTQVQIHDARGGVPGAQDLQRWTSAN